MVLPFRISAYIGRQRNGTPVSFIFISCVGHQIHKAPSQLAMQHSYKSRYCLDHVVLSMSSLHGQLTFPSLVLATGLASAVLPEWCTKTIHVPKLYVLCPRMALFIVFHVYLLMNVLVGEGKEKKTNSARVLCETYKEAVNLLPSIRVFWMRISS
jgi:hypothetical protein